ncbi:hypothetical protein FOCC_FOCC006258, partial [Frankliniella occidentalis]
MLYYYYNEVCTDGYHDEVQSLVGDVVFAMELLAVAVDVGVSVDLGVDGVAAVGDDGVEAAVLAGRVVHDALPAVGLQQRVLALHH